jgi:hypothetical protein
VKLRAVLVAALLCALLGGCGGGGNKRLSASEYRARLAALADEANAAQTNAQKAFEAKDVSDLQSRLRQFADAEERIGDKLARLKPPKNAEAANAELARGFHDTASELRDVVPGLSRFSLPAEAMASLRKLGNTNGGHEIDDALGKLKKLGYTKGS